MSAVCAPRFSVRPRGARAGFLPVGAVMFAVSVFAAVDAEAQIEIKTLGDGTRLVHNENATQRARRTSNKLVSVPEAQLDEWIQHYSRQNRLDPKLVQAVMQVESGYNPRALSSKGAIGLMQLMPATARSLRVDDPWDPEANIRGGTAYLRQQLNRFGDLRMALAAYNAGPTAVSRYGGIPPYAETQRYVRKVLSLLHRAPSPEVLAYARTQAKKRDEAAAAAQPPDRGKKVYLTRDANNQLVLTTTPPNSNAP